MAQFLSTSISGSLTVSGSGDNYFLGGSVTYLGNADSTENKARVYHSDNDYVDIYGYGLYMSRVSSYIRPTTDKNLSLNIGADSKTWDSVYFDSNYVIFRTDAGEHMRLDSVGRLGIGTATPSAQLHVSGTSDVLLVEGSGSTIFDVQGSQGQLFSVTDSLVGSLFSVNDISGLPIIEVFDTDKVVMGTFGQNTLVVTGSNVGIGTDSPARKFEIHENTTYLTIGEQTGYNPSSYGPILQTNSGTMVLPNRTYWSNSNVWIDRTGTAARFHGDGGINFSYYNVSTLTGMSLTNSGNVGIGETTPSAKLHVSQSNNGAYNTLIVEDADRKLKIGRDQISAYTKADVATQLYLNAGGTISMNASAGGTVIGATGLPSNSKLAVVGNISASGDMYADGKVVATSFTGSLSGLATSASYAIRAGSVDSANSASHAEFADNAGTVGGIAAGSFLRSDANDTGTGVITLSNDNTSGSLVIQRTSNADQKVWIRGGAGSGEGWVAAQYRLELRAGLGGSTDQDLILSTAAGEAMRIDAGNSNNVGIGTGSPTAKLDVAGAVQIGINSATPNVAYGLFGYSGVGLGIYSAATGANQGIGFWLNNGTAYEAGRWNSNGYLGIGTNTPDSKLHIGNGDITISGLNASRYIRFTENDNDFLGAYVNYDGDSNKLYLGTNNTTSAQNPANDIRALEIRRGDQTVYMLGDANIAGDLTVSGIVTAQEFHTEFVSASIVFSSGSTKFGNDTGDNHAFTGSINLLAQSGATGLRVERGSSLWMSMNSDSSRQIFQYSSNLDFRNINNTSIMYLSGSGNVGIGTSSPSEKLEVDGNVKSVNLISRNFTAGVSGYSIEGGDSSVQTYRFDADRFRFYNGNVGEIFTVYQNGTVQVQSGLNVNGYITAQNGSDIRLQATNDDTGDIVFLSGSGDELHRLWGGTGTFNYRTNGGTAYQLLHTGNYTSTLDTRYYTETEADSRFVNVAGDTMTGDLYLDDGSGATPSLYFKNGADNYWRFLMESGGDLSIKEGTSTRLTFKAGGNVGIGTTSPSTPLHVSSSQGNAVRIETEAIGQGAPQLYIEGNKAGSANALATLVELKSNTDYRGKGIIYSNADDTKEWYAGVPYTGGKYIIGFDSANDLPYYNESASLAILENGNVGIGTSAPTKPLDVNGDTLVRGDLTVNGNGIFNANGNDGTGTIRLNTGNAHASIVSHQSGTSESEGFTLINGVSTATISEVKIGGYLNEHNAATSIAFFTAANNTTRTGTQRVTINSAGNVGIGTTSPSHTLTVVGHVSASAFSGSFKGDGSGLTDVTAVVSLAEVLGTGNDAAGNNINNVGVLTANGINVAGAVSASNYNLPRGGRVTFYGNNSGDHSMSGTDASGNASDDLRINSYHNVYVNLDSNNNNTSTDTSFEISQHGGTGTLGTPFFKVRGDGNVGINNTAPGEKLDVGGNVRITGNIYQPNYSFHQLKLGNTNGYLWGNHNYTGSVGSFVDDVVLSANWHGVTNDHNNFASTNDFLGNAALALGRNHFRFFGARSGSVAPAELMRLDIDSGNLGIGTTSPEYKLDVNGEGQIGYINFEYNSNYAGIRWKDSAYNYQWKLGHDGPSGNWLYLYDYAMSTSAFTFKPNSDMLFTPGGNVGIGTTTPEQKLHVVGNMRLEGILEATEKSFNIAHPTKEGKRLIYGVLEGPEHGVYVRGKSTEKVIELPEVWTGLVHDDSITVQLTCKGKPFSIWVENIRDNKVYINTDTTDFEFYYYIQGERKDVDKLITERDAN